MTEKKTANHHGLSRLSTESSEIEKYYDNWAGDYDRHLKEWRYQAPERAAMILRQHLEPDSAILDAGCGTGLTGKSLADAGFTRIDGIDLSERSIAEAASHGRYRSLNRVNMQELPLPMESDMYDGLECVGVLTYLPDSEGLLSEFCRIVRPGGIILLTQRTDLFAERSFPAVLEALTSAGLWKVLEVSDPQPYLPQHEEYADKIMIHYIVCQVI